MPDLVFALSLLGFIDGMYFTFAYYGRVRRIKWVPEALCARDGSACVTVVRTPYARIFGAPNSILGAIYYLCMMYWAAGGCPVGYEVSRGNHYQTVRIGWILTGASFFTVAVGFYLVWALRAKLRVHCNLCYAAHAINVVLLVLVLMILG